MQVIANEILAGAETHHDGKHFVVDVDVSGSLREVAGPGLTRVRAPAAAPVEVIRPAAPLEV
jgi:hypothetical protein